MRRLVVRPRSIVVDVKIVAKHGFCAMDGNFCSSCHIPLDASVVAREAGARTGWGKNKN